MVVYRNMVEIGRVVLIIEGVNQGKLCVIVDIIDANRALVDGPCSGVKRGAEPFKNLSLTKWRLPIRHSARQKTVKNAWTTAKISEVFADSALSKNLKMRELRTTLTDFDRFKLMKAKQMRNRIINREFSKLKKDHKKNPPKPKAAPKQKPKGEQKSAPKGEPAKPKGGKK